MYFVLKKTKELWNYIKLKVYWLPVIKTPFILMETCVVFQVTPMYKNKNIQKIENELMETAPG